MNAPASTPVAQRWRLRASDFALLCEAGALDDLRRAELIDGDIYTMSPQMMAHARAKMRLGMAIGNKLAEIGSALEAVVEVSVLVAEHSVPEPDIVVSSFQGDRFVPAESVALVVEISHTTLALDLGRKAQLYAGAGIPEYWVVDLDARRTRIHSAPAAGDYTLRTDVPFDVELEAVTIPSLNVGMVGFVNA